VVSDEFISYSDANQRRTVEGSLSDNWDKFCEEVVKTSVEALSRNLHGKKKNENQRYASQEICFPV
jgi:hypothetical protein